MEEINDFVHNLPPQLRTKVILLTYRETFKKIHYLQHKPANFVTWVCPLLKPQMTMQDNHIYYEGDAIESMFFLQKGAAGFVLPFKINIVYVEIQEGDLACCLGNGQLHRLGDGTAARFPHELLPLNDRKSERDRDIA